MEYIGRNLAAILAATAAGLLVGAVYTILARRGSRVRGGVALALTAAVAEFWLASILAGALILAPPNAGAWTMALGSAVVIWIGFVLPALAVTHRFRGLSTGALAADAAHWLGVMVLQAAVLHVIGLARP